MSTSHGVKQKVQVWIYFQDSPSAAPAFLILKMIIERGGGWQPVTGGVEEGETLEVAAQREAQEETGLTFKGPPRSVGEPFTFQSRWSGEVVVEHGFALQALSQDVQIDPREHTEYRWVSSDEAIRTVSYPSNAMILRALLKQLD
jgi:8-oxo-dGTP pyrophosphatase MutT (NUDIX family)